MRLTLVAAATATAMSRAVPALAGGEWPDGPNKTWFENLQRPDIISSPIATPTQVAVLLRHR